MCKKTYGLVVQIESRIGQSYILISAPSGSYRLDVSQSFFQRLDLSIELGIIAAL